MENSNPITYFAETDARGKRVKFGIKTEDRLRHIYLIGKTGMGKSTLLENMAIQDIQNGNGVAFLDPHGSTAEKLLDYVPESRIKDVIYFAPFDTEHPISFNIMEDVGPQRRHLVVSGLMSAFEKIWEDAWSARMAYILQNTLAALLEYPGATLLGVNRMYSDKAYRAKVVESVTDPTIRSFWVDEYAKYTDRYTQEATPAIQNKIGQFASNPLVRNIIGQPKSSFDIRKIMDEKKIFIVNLSKGLVGENNANLLGSMLVTKIYLAAMSRADASPAELKQLPNFYLYVDEFQSFANKSFADILSEARKYKLSLNITHQYIEQMAEEVRAAVFGNVGTMITYRVGSFDAEVLEKEFAPVFTMQDIVNLDKYQIYLKLMIDQVASQPFSAVALPPFPRPEVSYKEQVLKASREAYAKPREEVEKAIREWHGAEEKNEVRSMNHELREEKREKKIEVRPKISPALNVPKPVQAEVKIKPAEPEIKKEEKKNILADAIKEAMKQKSELRIMNHESSKKQEEKKEEKKVEIRTEVKKQTVSLQELKHGDKNQNKEATPENKNALKEAIQKASIKGEVLRDKEEGGEEKKGERKEEKKTPPPTPARNDFQAGGPPRRGGEQKPAAFAKSSGEPKEVPEETLRKILKGE